MTENIKFRLIKNYAVDVYKSANLFNQIRFLFQFEEQQ